MSSLPMAKHHNIIAADGEFELHEEIIHQIQSLMNVKDAARTSLLSRCWNGAWCTRPDLVFDQNEFRNRMDEFPTFTKKTMQRYEDLELPIKSFRLWMMEGYDSLALELISRAIKLGVADLKIEIETSYRSSSCVLLPEEVLQSKTLTRLHVYGLKIDLKNRGKGLTTCPKLKSLTLFNAIVDGDLFRDLISRCPLIEELTWNKPGKREESTTTSSLLESSINVEEFDKLQFHKLKYLRLTALDDRVGNNYIMNVKDALYRHDLSRKFPCLRELVVWDNHSKYVRICSSSLESVTIRVPRESMWSGEFDVPNIRKFRVSSSLVPRLVIKTRSREWESYIDINCVIRNPNAWFSSLNQLVKVLSMSRVSLSLSVDISGCRRHHGYVGGGLAVRELKLYRHNLTLEFLDSLLWSYRPKLVKIEKRCVVGMEDQLNVGEFRQLRSLPWKTLFDYSSYQGQYVHFQLN